MANKTVLKKEKKSKFKAGSRYFTSGDARAYLFIHLSKSSNCITKFSELNAYSVKKIYLFLESNDQYGRKKNLVQLCYYMTREFHRHSQESTARRQFLQKSASNLLKSRGAVSVKENTI